MNMFRSRIDVKSAALHENVNSAKDVTEHVEAARLACYESHVRALTGSECEAAIEIVRY